MGYRSEVAYVIKFDSDKTLNEFIALVMAMGGTKLAALKECGIDRQAKEIQFYADDVKWYDSYPDVQAHTWLYEFALERFPENADYKFIRIGEDDTDIQIECDGIGDYIETINVRRSIDVPFYGYDQVGDSLCVEEQNNG